MTLSKDKKLINRNGMLRYSYSGEVFEYYLWHFISPDLKLLSRLPSRRRRLVSRAHLTSVPSAYWGSGDPSVSSDSNSVIKWEVIVNGRPIRGVPQLENQSKVTRQQTCAYLPWIRAYSYYAYSVK